MTKYFKKEDQFCKYYVRVNFDTKDAIAVYRNHDGKRFGINKFTCSPELYDKEYSVSTQQEFEIKLEFIKKLIC